MLSSESGINFGTLVGHIHTQALTQNKFRDLTEEELEMFKNSSGCIKDGAFGLRGT